MKRNKYPKYWLGAVAGGLALASTAAGIVNDIFTTTSAESQLANAQKSTAYENGVGYTTLNVPGASSNFWASIFNPGAQRRENERAQRMAAGLNNWSRNNAGTIGLQKQAAENEKGFTNSGMRFRLGKDVNTSIGVRKGKQNAWVSKGEYIWDGFNPPVRVNRGKNDTAPAYLTGKDTVFTNSKQVTPPPGFKTIAQAVPYAAATGNLPKLAMWQQMIHMNNNKNKYKYGKNPMPKFQEGVAPGWLSIANGTLGLLGGLSQIYNSRQKPQLNNTYVDNPYEQQAIMDMEKLDYDTTPIEKDILNLNAGLVDNIKNSGALSGAQKYMYLTQGANNVFDAVNKARLDAQNKRIELKKNIIDSKIKLGADKASRQQQASQYDQARYDQAMVAKRQAQQKGLKNMIGAGSTMFQDLSNREMQKYMMKQYASDVDRKNAVAQAYINSLTGGNTTQDYKFNGTGIIDGKPLPDSPTWLKDKRRWLYDGLQTDYA